MLKSKMMLSVILCGLILVGCSSKASSSSYGSHEPLAVGVSSSQPTSDLRSEASEDNDTTDSKNVGKAVSAKIVSDKDYQLTSNEVERVEEKYKNWESVDVGVIACNVVEMNEDTVGGVAKAALRNSCTDPDGVDRATVIQLQFECGFKFIGYNFYVYENGERLYTDSIDRKYEISEDSDGVFLTLTIGGTHKLEDLTYSINELIDFKTGCYAIYRDNAEFIWRNYEVKSGEVKPGDVVEINGGQYAVMPFAMLSSGVTGKAGESWSVGTYVLPLMPIKKLPHTGFNPGDITATSTIQAMNGTPRINSRIQDELFGWDTWLTVPDGVLIEIEASTHEELREIAKTLTIKFGDCEYKPA